MLIKGAGGVPLGASIACAAFFRQHQINLTDLA